MTIHPELRFLAACSFVPASADGFARQKQQLEATLPECRNPDVLWAGIQNHRIFALAERVLREHKMELALGEAHAATLQIQAQRCRMRSLQLAAAAMQLSALMSKAGTGYRFLKGPLLSQKIYGDAGMRHSKDLDLIIAPGQVTSAVDVMRKEGWEVHDAALWLRGGLYRRISELRLHHMRLFHPMQRIGVELHWRIEAARSPALEQRWWSRWPAEASGVSPIESLYLCMHGAKHAWSRLKWLGDIASIINRQPDLWLSCEEAMVALGLELAVAQAILLLELLFGVEPDAAAARIVESQPRAHALAAFALNEMREADEHRRRTFGESWMQRRYFAAFTARYSFLDRLAYQLGHWLIEETLCDNPAFLAAMPIRRAAGLLNRYVLSKEG